MLDAFGGFGLANDTGRGERERERASRLVFAVNVGLSQITVSITVIVKRAITVILASCGFASRRCIVPTSLNSCSYFLDFARQKLNGRKRRSREYFAIPYRKFLQRRNLLDYLISVSRRGVL